MECGGNLMDVEDFGDTFTPDGKIAEMKYQ